MVDRYTKVVLSVIALCLIYLCVTTTLSVTTAEAASKPMKDVMDVNVVQVGGFAVNLNPLPVKVIR